MRQALGRLLVGGVVGVAGILTAVGLVSARSDSAEVISGCVTRNGTIRIADTCGGKETPISWNVVGPPGPRGASGERGPHGPRGASAVVVDANGRVLGPIVNMSDTTSIPGAIASVVVERDGHVGLVQVNRERLFASFRLFYETLDCSGAPLMAFDPTFFLIAGTASGDPSGAVWVADRDAQPQSITVRSWYDSPGSTCQGDPNVRLQMLPATFLFNRNEFVPPFRVSTLD